MSHLSKWRGCKGRRRFKDAAQARRTAARIVGRSSGAQLVRPVFCTHCRAYHLTGGLS